MSIIVQKFGGSSVANKEKLLKVCKHIVNEYDKGNQLVVVVSAQGKTTDNLIFAETEITKDPCKREHDVLVATGEQITIAKLVMCLNELGYNAISYMGWQLPIITDNNYGNARIKKINLDKIHESLNANKIVIVAGFQGVDEQSNITTLGRGGSDTTAVALAAVLKAEKCEIFTDVDGIYSADPNKVEDVVKIETITYDEMLELASLGAKVLHNRCVEIGKNFNIPIIVKSTFEEKSEGTIVKYQKDLEDLYISGIAKIDNISIISLKGIKDKLEETHQLFKLLSENNINIDIIIQSLAEENLKTISFSINTFDLEKTLNILNSNLEILNIEQIDNFDNFSKISLVGIGIANSPGVAAKMFEALYEKDITIHMISTSEIKISVLVNQDKAVLAMQSIHNKFINNNIK